MKTINRKTLFAIFISTLLLTGCMPDSLTKWNADPPQLVVEAPPETPVAPTTLSYADTFFILSSEEPVYLEPTVDGSQLQFEIYRCDKDPADTTPPLADCSTPATSSELPSGVTFDTTTGILSGTYTSSNPFTIHYYQVRVFNSEVPSGAEPTASFSLEIYEPMGSNGNLIIPAGTKMILTVADTGVYTDDGLATAETRNIVAEGNVGHARVDYINVSPSGDTLYVTLTQDGFFLPGFSVDVGIGDYSTEKTLITDAVIALPTGVASDTKFLTLTIDKGNQLLWNAKPLLSTEHFTASLPVQDDPSEEKLRSVSLKGLSSCLDDTCRDGVNSSLKTTNYIITVSNPLVVNEEDYLSLPININISEEPRYVGLAQQTMVRVYDASEFSEGDIISAHFTNSANNTDVDFKGIVIGTKSDVDFDILFVKVEFGYLIPGVQVGTQYPLVGNGVTSVISEIDEVNYKVKAIDPYTAVVQVSNTSGVTGTDAEDFYNAAVGAQRPKVAFLITPITGTGTPQSDGNDPNQYWHAQTYMLGAEGRNLLLLRTEMTAMMDLTTTNPTPVLPDIVSGNTTLSDNYFDFGFRTEDNNKVELIAGSTARTLYNFDQNLPNQVYITGITQHNISINDSTSTLKCDKLTNPGQELTTSFGQSGQIIACNGDSFRASMDGITLDDFIIPGDSVDFANPYVASKGSIEKMSLDTVFTVYQDKPATLLFSIAQGSELQFEISPPLPDGFERLDSLNHIYSEKVTAPVGQSKHVLTIFNALGKIEYPFTLEVLPSFEVTNTSTASSYIMHQSGQKLNRRPCRITKGQIDTGSNKTILCYMEAGEEELHANGVSLNFNVSKDLCESVVFKPYFYYKSPYMQYERSFGDNTSQLLSIVAKNPECGGDDTFGNDVGICTGGAFDGQACDSFNDNLQDISNFASIDGTGLITVDESALCEALLPGYKQNCGNVEIQLEVTEYGNPTLRDEYDAGIPGPGQDGLGGNDCSATESSKVINCTGTGFVGCLGGAGSTLISTENNGLPDFNPFTDRLIREKRFTTSDGTVAMDPSQTEFAVNVGSSVLSYSNRYYANYTLSNQCFDVTETDKYSYYSSSWEAYARQEYYIDWTGLENSVNSLPDYTRVDRTGAPTDANATIARTFIDPWKYGNPYYSYECQDAAGETKAKILVAVRDWNVSFKAQDNIDQVKPAKMVQGDPVYDLSGSWNYQDDDFQSWDSTPNIYNDFVNKYPYNDGGLQDCSATLIPKPDPDAAGDGTPYVLNLKYVLDVLGQDPAKIDDPYYGFPYDDGEP